MVMLGGSSVGMSIGSRLTVCPPRVEYRFQSFDELKRISQELRTGQWGTEEYYDMVIKLIPRREVRTRATD